MFHIHFHYPFYCQTFICLCLISLWLDENDAHKNMDDIFIHAITFHFFLITNVQNPQLS